MYVCVCNAYRESHVREVVEESSGNYVVTVEQVYARLGSAPRCGRCVLYVKDLISTMREERAQTIGRNPAGVEN